MCERDREKEEGKDIKYIFMCVTERGREIKRLREIHDEMKYGIYPTGL